MAHVNTPRRPQGVITIGVQTVMHLVALVVLAWLIVAVGFGLYRINHSQNNLEAHLQTLVQTTHRFLPRNSGIEQQWQQTKQTMGNFWNLQKYRFSEVRLPQSLSENSRCKTLALKFNQVGRLLNYVTELIFCKLVFFLYTLPLFLLMMGLAVVDGLVQRDIRKFQAAQESALFFHAITQRFGFCFFLPLFIYFVLPWPVSPIALLAPQALGLGLLTQCSVRCFKKYL